ncbi:MAG: class I SAM-dependent methyltransferase family protein [Halobacteriaceae archaeon]
MAEAVRVPKPEVEAAIAALREAGVYDDTRRVSERDADTVAVPVTGPPPADCDYLLVEGAPDPRVRGLDDRLRERGFSPAEVTRAPASWAVVGDVVLVAFGECERRAEVADAIRELQGADTVLARGGIDGPHREPDVEVVAGSGETETVHVEDGTKYALDLAEVMFSPGNQRERVRMGEVVAPGESVADLFAGVGYFTLPMARAGADVTAVERNPAAFRYLVENCALNAVTDRVTPVRADCRDAAVPAADRVVMGHYDAREYLDVGLDALAPGGTVHLHDATPADRPFERPVDRLREAAAARDRAVTVRDRREVKSYSAGVVHVVVDARLD